MLLFLSVVLLCLSVVLLCLSVVLRCLLSEHFIDDLSHMMYHGTIGGCQLHANALLPQTQYQKGLSCKPYSNITCEGTLA